MSRRFTRFEKIILSPGVYRVTKNGQTREVDNFTPERIKGIAKTGQQMLDDGLRIPMPGIHFDKNGKLPQPVVELNGIEYIDPVTGEKADWDSSINLGFATSFFTNELGQLVAVVEAPGDPDNLSDPAGKVGTTIQETSLGIAKEFLSGKGKIYKDAPVHIAACMHAVEASQTNFVPLPPEMASKVDADHTLVSMSSVLMSTVRDSSGSGVELSINDDDKNETNLTGENVAPNISQLLVLLREDGIDLPADTVLETLIERLTIALLQKRACKAAAEEEENPKPPKNASEKSGYSTMTTAANPPVPPTASELVLMNMIAGGARTSITDRAAALVKKGVPQAIVDKYITPKLVLDVATMSMVDVDPATGKIFKFGAAEEILAAVEEVISAKITTMSLGTGLNYLGEIPDGATEHALRDDEKPSKEEDDSLVDDIANG